MTQTQHSPVYKAAEQIMSLFDDDIFSNEKEIAEIIERITHHSEMLAFIEKVAEGDLANFVPDIQREAFALIKKVRG